LIAAALERPAQRILDLGAGTGCIALTLLAEWPDATAVLSDISPAALAVARANAEALGVDARATFLISDWFAAVEGAFDLILSNPPYISASEMAELSPDVRDWEPHLALTPGGDGLSAYRRIAEGLRGHIASNGRALLEIGANQAADVSDIVRETEPQHLTVLTDLGGRDRAIALQY
ncbi:MAG: HemK family protein methyltransferase, partial [Pseudomonadota bacterium]